MQGAEDEVEGSVLTYVTETEFRKQRSKSPSCNSLTKGKGQSKRDTLSRAAIGCPLCMSIPTTRRMAEVVEGGLLKPYSDR